MANQGRRSLGTQRRPPDRPQWPARSAGCDANGLQGRPIYHGKRDSIEAHQTIVFAALAASRWIEGKTGWSTTTNNPVDTLALAAQCPRTSREKSASGQGQKSTPCTRRWPL